MATGVLRMMCRTVYSPSWDGPIYRIYKINKIRLLAKSPKPSRIMVGNLAKGYRNALTATVQSKRVYTCIYIEQYLVNKWEMRSNHSVDSDKHVPVPGTWYYVRSYESVPNDLNIE